MTLTKLISTALLSLGLTFVLHGQTLRAIEKAGDQAMASNDYYAAIMHYGEILTLKEDRLDIHFKYGLAARAFSAFEIAEKSFQKVASTEIEDEDLGEELSNVKFWLGDTQKKLGKYDQAIISFKDFIENSNTLDPLDVELSQFATKQIEDCMWASEQVEKRDYHYTITHLGDDVNTPYAEFAPVATDEDLYFTSLRYENERFRKNRILSFSKVLKSKKGVLSSVLFDSYEITEKHVAHTAFTKDNKKVIFTVCGYSQDRSIICDLFSADLLSDDSWGNVTKLPENINQDDITSTQPNIGYENKTPYLYFVSDREGGKGGKDIWRSRLSASGGVGTPENLSSVNTERDDITPFFHSATGSLYFSSNGRQNFGGFDVYQRNMNEEGVVSIEHYGFPLNSSYNDLYFTLNEAESKGHISSNRPESKYLVDSLASCCYDLYEIEFENLLNLLANVFDKKTDEPILGSSADIKELIHDVQISETNLNSHIYNLDVLRNREYELTFSKEGYESETIQVSTMDLERDAKLSKDIKLNPLPIGLLATSYDKESMAALTEVTYSLSVLNGGDWIPLESAKIDDISAFELSLDANTEYRITAAREGYHENYKPFNTYEMIGGNHKKVSLLLEKMTPSEVLKKGIDEFLPVPLYFDNDRPRGNLSPTMTSFTYGELNDRYYKRKADYSRINSAGLFGEERTMMGERLEYFFDEDIRSAKASLNVFCSRMVAYLQLGNTAEIMIQGYASPLAALEYNIDLGKRRISSIQNHINNWDSGKLLPFVENGSLKINYRSYGESEARPDVSDNPDDIKNSIYSIDASRERRVEIIEVK